MALVYDELGRVTEKRRDSMTGPLLATYSYDNVATTSTRTCRSALLGDRIVLDPD